MSLAYLNSQEMEEAGLTPKSPFRVRAVPEPRHVTHGHPSQYAFLETDIPDNWPQARSTAPQRVHSPEFPIIRGGERLMPACHTGRHGIAPLPTAMQRNNEKSGVARAHRESGEHRKLCCVDGYDVSLPSPARGHRSMDPAVYSAERDRVRKPDETYRLLKLNTPQPYRTPKPAVGTVSGRRGRPPIAVSTGRVSIRNGGRMRTSSRTVAQMPNLPLSPPQARSCCRSPSR